MGIQYKINKAEAIINSFCGEELKALERACSEIQSAQDQLIKEAEDHFRLCMNSCKGICCRNINPNEIITLLDFVYILSIDKTNIAQILECSKKETLFSSNCIFLKNDIGPCIFPYNLKPEKCIITFCSDTRTIRKEIKLVRSKFSRLSRFVKYKRPLMWFGF